MYHNSKPMNLFIFDIETIPDVDAAKNLTDCISTDITEQRKALTNYHIKITNGANDFLRQPFHRVVAISYAWLEINYDVYSYEKYSLKTLSSALEGKVSDEKDLIDEKQLIKGFFKYIAKAKPRIVTFNGRCFDIPVLKYRAMKYGISCKEFFAKEHGINYQYRYSSDYNCDLLEMLSDYGASARIKLNEICSILGFPGKFGIDGSQVSELFDKGDIISIRNYCETDVLNTYLVYLRYSLFIGKINLEGYNQSIEDVLNYINLKESENKYHLKEFKDAWIEASNGKLFLDNLA